MEITDVIVSMMVFSTMKDLSFILLSLKDLYVGTLREAAACSLYDEVRRRATADERGFRFRMLAGMLVNARQTYFSTQAVDESVRPFVQAVYADVARHEPGDYPSGALINLVVVGARLGVLQVREGQQAVKREPH